ncbi:XRE family transcriptional regulator [Streptococcus dysgalactiae subsp. dysgalactiae]|uniref:replication initiation factor domain-containing protein n=1 Tax=Streptococcus dysgalactiae TaxID=1334 RepID=UPI001CF20526|nr:replication initiation factor domain-containing protein [Streptococcus dysgalactiae]MCB2836301.1 XRE family transcriptional regulator [Streptococcus dysgalactiae subsp. dysgalactiae]
MNPIYLKKFRKKMKLSQKDFAECVGIERSLISKYETGKKSLSLERFQEIKSCFGYLKDNDNTRLQVMIDYVRLTIKTVMDLELFCRHFLHCRFKDFTSVESKLMNYNHIWKRGDIWIFDYADKHETGNFQITVQLSGQGCRQLELLMEQGQFTWIEWLSHLRATYRDDLNVTRFDIAIDELYLGKDKEQEQFLLSDMIAKYYQHELDFESLRTWNYIGGGALNFEDLSDIEQNRQGISLYFGSRQSEMYFNFYEKRYELARQEGLTVEEALEIFELWNRYEIRLAQSKANSVVDEMISGVPLGEIARGLINSKLDVYDGQNQFGAFLADQKWQMMFGGVEPLKFVTKPEPYNIDRTIRWLMHQVSDSLALVNEYDSLTAGDNLQMIINAGEINERGEKILDNIKSALGLSKGGG